MNNISLNELKIKDFFRIRRLYRSSFPAAERKPFIMMLKMRREGRQELLTVSDGENKHPVGIAFILTDGKNYILDYLAVQKELRSKGYGAAILEELKNRYAGSTVIVEIERSAENAPDNCTEKRRKNFYLRCGLKEAGVNIKLFGVDMELLYFGGEHIDFDFYYSLLSGAFGEKRKAILKSNVSVT